jgi:DNA polymerase-3 subunit gamma/tau
MPARARRKVYIIDEVHMLSAHSFNALLKTLEEPPAHVVFIFATTEVHKIPVTILSRCQRFDFKLIPTARLTAHLEGILGTEKIAADADAVRVIARQAAGSVRDALSLLDQVIAYVGDARLTAELVAEVLGIADRRVLVELAQAVVARDPAATLRVLARTADRGVDLAQLARAFLAFLRDLEIVGRVKDAADLVDATPDELEEARALVASAPAGLMPVLFDRWARAVDEASRSQTPRLLFEMAAVDLTTAEPLVPLGDLLDRLEGLEGRLRGEKSAAPAPPSAPRAVAAAAVVAAPAAAAAPAPTPPPAAPVEARAPAADGPQEAWRRVLASFEKQRPRLGALLAHAEVIALGGGSLTLAFAQKVDADAAEKARGDIEAVVSTALGQPTRVTFTVGAPAGGAAAVRSEVGTESDAAAADRKNREAEARQHPMIRRAQDLFGASLKEIKT